MRPDHVSHTGEMIVDGPAIEEDTSDMDAMNHLLTIRGHEHCWHEAELLSAMGDSKQRWQVCCGCNESIYHGYWHAQPPEGHGRYAPPEWVKVEESRT
jgi:hypothetical protein